MSLFEKWWSRALISFVMAFAIAVGMDSRSDGRYGIPVYAFVILYIGLSLMYGFSDHNRSKADRHKGSDDVLDGD